MSELIKQERAEIFARNPLQRMPKSENLSIAARGGLAEPI